MYKNNFWFIYCDNATFYTALFFLRLFSKNTVSQPTYSPDLVPCDFWLFGKLKKSMRERRFNMIEKTKTLLKAILENYYFDFCEKSIFGDYFKGNKVDLKIQ